MHEESKVGTSGFGIPLRAQMELYKKKAVGYFSLELKKGKDLVRLK